MRCCGAAKFDLGQKTVKKAAEVQNLVVTTLVNDIKSKGYCAAQGCSGNYVQALLLCWGWGALLRQCTFFLPKTLLDQGIVQNLI